MQGGLILQADRTGAYMAVREDASPKRQRSKRPLSADQGGVNSLTLLLRARTAPSGPR